MVLQKEDQPGFGKEFLLESDEWKNSNNLAEPIKEIAEKFVPEGKRNDCTVFDMGCGTGLVGEVMQPKGWN